VALASFDGLKTVQQLTPFDITRQHMNVMTQITARIPDELAREVDAAASQLKRSRAQVVRQALEYYLADLEDLRLGLERLQDPGDPILDWSDVRRGLLDPDQA
jgi:RHH-type transcriptional regulator, rel operon repressor / antitoxin RelB